MRAKTIEAIKQGNTKYTSNLGTPELRQTLSGYMAGIRSVTNLNPGS